MRAYARVAALLIVFIATDPGRAAETSSLDPGAMSALQKMGTYLRSLTTVQIEAVTTDEDVLDNGQKIQYSSSVSVLARKPNQLRAEVSNDRFKRLYLYDGSSFTLFAERVGYYATLHAPPTIGKLVDKLHTEYDFSVPLEDLFRWGDAGWSADAIKAAIDVGPSEVSGVTCEQYALHQDDVDWQIWIQRGDYPLPRKLVVTTLTDPARPQHSAVFTWNLAPSYDETAFKFAAPAGAQRVAFQKPAPAAASAK